MIGEENVLASLYRPISHIKFLGILHRKKSCNNYFLESLPQNTLPECMVHASNIYLFSLSAVQLKGKHCGNRVVDTFGHGYSLYGIVLEPNHKTVKILAKVFIRKFLKCNVRHWFSHHWHFSDVLKVLVSLFYRYEFMCGCRYCGA